MCDNHNYHEVELPAHCDDCGWSCYNIDADTEKCWNYKRMTEEDVKNILKTTEGFEEVSSTWEEDKASWILDEWVRITPFKPNFVCDLWKKYPQIGNINKLQEKTLEWIKELLKKIERESEKSNLQQVNTSPEQMKAAAERARKDGETRAVWRDVKINDEKREE